MFDEKTKSLVSVYINGESVSSTKTYTVAFQGYHYSNCQANIGLSTEELGEGRVITANCQEALEEFLRSHQNIGSKVEGRLNYK